MYINNLVNAMYTKNTLSSPPILNCLIFLHVYEIAYITKLYIYQIVFLWNRGIVSVQLKTEVGLIGQRVYKNLPTFWNVKAACPVIQGYNNALSQTIISTGQQNICVRPKKIMEVILIATSMNNLRFPKQPYHICMRPKSVMGIVL